MSSLKEHPKALAFVVFAAVVLSSGMAYTYWPAGTPPMPETMEDVPALLESEAYKNLSPELRREYVMRVQQLMKSADREQRREVMSNDASRDAMRDMFKQMMVDRAKQFALADEATRRQMITEDRARMEQMGGRGGPGGPAGRPGGEGRGGEGGERGDRPEPTEEEKAERRAKRESQIEEWVNEGNGQDWALIREYRQQLRQD
ncbi:MAG: hypothetical protein AAGB26_02840 [Planctomycetota bacterium]